MELNQKIMSKKKKNSNVSRYSIDDGTYSREKGKGIVRRAIKVGNNDSCPCESGVKFKRCCKGKKLFLK